MNTSQNTKKAPKTAIKEALKSFSVSALNKTNNPQR